MLFKSRILSLLLFALISGAAAGESSMGEWRRVVSPRGPIRTVAMSSGHQVILYESGLIECRGLNQMGECNVPEIPGAVKDIAAGDGFSMALLEDGTVRFWGDPAFSVDGMKAKLIAATGNDSHVTGLAVLGENGHMHCRYAYTREGSGAYLKDYKSTGDALRVVMCGYSPAVLRADGSVAFFDPIEEIKGPFADVTVSAGWTILLAHDGTLSRVIGQGLGASGSSLEKLASGARSLCQRGGLTWLTSSGGLQMCSFLSGGNRGQFSVLIENESRGPENLRELLTDNIAVLKDGSLSIRGALPFGTDRFDTEPPVFVKLTGDLALDSKGRITPTDNTILPVSNEVADFATGGWGTLLLQRDGAIRALPKGSVADISPDVPSPQSVRDGLCVAVGDSFAAVGHRDGTVSVWKSPEHPDGPAWYFRCRDGKCTALTAAEDRLLVSWQEEEVEAAGNVRTFRDQPIRSVTAEGLSKEPDFPVHRWAVQAGLGRDFTVILDEDGAVHGWGFIGGEPNVVPPVLPRATAITADSDGVAVALDDTRIVWWGGKVRGTFRTGERMKQIVRYQSHYSQWRQRVIGLTEQGQLRIWETAWRFDLPWRPVELAGMAGPGNLSRRTEPPVMK